jgi:hypothetical protein
MTPSSAFAYGCRHAPVAALVLVAFGASVASAADDVTPARSMRRWQVTLSFAYTNHDQINKQTESMMNNAGLGDDTYFLGIRAVEYPLSYSGSSGLPLTGTIARSIRPRLQVALALEHSDLGVTEGRRETSFDEWHLTLGTNATSATLLVQSDGRIHAGLGPSLHWIEDWSEGWGTPRESRHMARLGLAADAGVSWPVGERYFLDGSLRYHWAGSIHRGPFDLQSTQGTMTVPESSIRLDHWVGTVGLGVSF